MNDIFLAWILFILLGIIIAFSGFKLSYLADQIAQKTKLGRNLIGIMMLATVTSLPELVTGVTSVTVNNNPNLALGDIIGSCCFNLVTVVLLDLIYHKGSIYSRTTQGHMFTGLMSVILIGFIGLSLTMKNQSWFQIGHIGVSSLFIPIFYVMSMRAIYNFEKKIRVDTEEIISRKGLRKDLILFTFFAFIIVSCGIFLPPTAEKIIRLMGWNSAFMGTFFVALVTSFPEISVTISALRLNAAELAFSNLLGSNIFNVVILAVDDVFYTKGALFADVSSIHTSTAFSALMMTGLVLVALMKPPQRKFFNIISGMSFLLLGIYCATIFIAFNG